MTTRRELPSDYPPDGLEVRLIQQFVDLRGRRVLEIGCGDGRLTRQYSASASSVVAVEPDRQRVALARRLAKSAGVTNVEFLVGSAERMRLGAATFDVALFSWSL